MAPTKDRMRKYRQKAKEDPDKWNQMKEKDRRRKQEKRIEEKKNLTEEGKAMRRVRTRDRMHKLRERKKQERITEIKVNFNPLGSYSAKKSLTRAAQKVQRVLPSSPRKQQAVLAKIVEEKLGKVLYEEPGKSKKSSPKRIISEDLIKKAVDIYSRDDVSWQAPGKRDVISVKNRETGKRVSLQKRYLVMKIGELKNLFDEENTPNKMSLAAFYRLRPEHILLSSKIPHNVCVCSIHANFIFLVKAITPFLNSVNSYKELMQEACCDMEREDCMLENCDRCKNFDVRTLVSLSDTSNNREVQVKKWDSIEGRLQVTTYSTSPQSIFQTFNDVFPSFKRHSFIKKVQSDFFEMKKESLANNEIVMQIDYSENASLISQDEIQAAHWAHGQVTLFTCVIWTRKKIISYVVVSDDLNHTRFSSWLFIKSIMTDLKLIKKLEFNSVFIFSDNCASQFKSKFTVANLCYLADDLNVDKVTLDFFASGHGEGAVDAVGGVVKRNVWLAIKSRRAIVNTPQDFYEIALKEVTNINLLYVPATDIENSSQLLDERWNNVAPLKGIQNMHHFERSNEANIFAAITAKSKMEIFKMQRSTVFSAAVAVRIEKLNVSEVYSDSEDDTEDNQSTSNCSALEKEIVDKNSLTPGIFLKVRLRSQDKRMDSQDFVGITQSGVNDDNFIQLLFLKLFSEKDGHVYKINNNDEKYVHMNEIVSVLPQPKIITAGSRILYEFQVIP